MGDHGSVLAQRTFFMNFQGPKSLLTDTLASVIGLFNVLVKRTMRLAIHELISLDFK